VASASVGCRSGSGKPPPKKIVPAAGIAIAREGIASAPVRSRASHRAASFTGLDPRRRIAISP
jgi:hypothetical protein